MARQNVLMARHRLRKAREEMRDWARSQRERTRYMIELGGLVQKAGLVDLTQDDRAILLGAFFDIAAQLQGSGTIFPADLRIRWRRADYRAKWSLPVGYPIIASNYATHHIELARSRLQTGEDEVLKEAII